MQLVQDGRDTFVSWTDGCKQNQVTGTLSNYLTQLPGWSCPRLLPAFEQAVVTVLRGATILSLAVVKFWTNWTSN